MTDKPTLISREPWWAEPPTIFQSEEDITWGYLEYYSDGTWRFDHSRPTDEEIASRKSCRLEKVAG